MAFSALLVSSLTLAIEIEGYISKVGLGLGRSDNERQFLFLNGRPVDLPKIARCISETWRQFEVKQKPTYVINLKVPGKWIDVNVTPDKREVFILGEDLLIENFCTYLKTLWEPFQSTYKVEQAAFNNFKPTNRVDDFLKTMKKDVDSEKNMIEDDIAEKEQPSNNSTSTPQAVIEKEKEKEIILDSPSLNERRTKRKHDVSKSKFDVISSAQKPLVQRHGNTKIVEEKKKEQHQQQQQ